MTDQTPAWDRPEVKAVVSVKGNIWSRYGRQWISAQGDRVPWPAPVIEKCVGPMSPLVRESPSITLAEHAASLARVADHAHAQGWREGHGQACEEAYRDGFRAGWRSAEATRATVSPAAPDLYPSEPPATRGPQRKPWLTGAQAEAAIRLARRTLDAGGLAGSDGHQGTPGNPEAAESRTEPQGVAS